MSRLKRFGLWFYKPVINVLKDYRDVFIETGKKCAKKPIKTFLYSSVLVTTGFLSHYNPSMLDFKTTCLLNHHRLLLVSDFIRKKQADEFINSARMLEREGRLGYCSFLVFSVMFERYIDDDTREFGKVFMKPRLAEYLDRIVDVGFLGDWHYMSNAMIDYDVNEEEFL